MHGTVYDKAESEVPLLPVVGNLGGSAGVLEIAFGLTQTALPPEL